MLDQKRNSNIIKQAITGSVFNVFASIATIVIGFSRSVLLARLLLPEEIGIFSLALFFIHLFGKMQISGFTIAFVQKKEYTQKDIGTHFWLRVCSFIVMCTVVLLATPFLHFFYPEQELLIAVLWGLVCIEMIHGINATPLALLSKKLDFRRIAILKVFGSIIALFVAGSLAFSGAGVWSLVGQEASIAVVNFVGLWLVSRPWQPTFNFSSDSAKDYLRFFRFTFWTANIDLLLDKFDDFWIGTVSNSQSLGYYSKAYEMAQYPRAGLAAPLINVFYPTFALLQDDRQQLSQAYFRVMSLLVRIGFWFTGVFILVAPQFVLLILGEKWLPMTTTLQFMIIYVMLDPLHLLSGRLITAVGNPKSLTQTKIVQLIFFIPAVILLERLAGINGVAMAANLMMIIGFIFLLTKLHHYVDFSLRRLMLHPFIALNISFIVTWFIVSNSHIELQFGILLIKICVLSAIYAGWLLLFERRQIMMLFNYGFAYWQDRKLSSIHPEKNM